MRRPLRTLISSAVVIFPVAVPLTARHRGVLRSVALVSTAMTGGLSMCHALELPAKRRLPPAEWWQLSRTLYRPWFGRAGHAEGVALLAAPALAVSDPASRPAALAAATALLVANPVLFLTLVAPTNKATLEYVDREPEDCVRLRDRWEFGHLARFICHALAFTALACDAGLHRRDEQHRRR